MWKFISELVFCKILGWRFKGGEHIKKAPKAMFAPIPHTSYWDFPIGLIIREVFDINIRFAAKDSLFKWPYGWIFKKLGGYPVDRSKSNNMVEAVAKIYDEHESFYLCIAPEGTRKKVQKLKTGFYYISKLANVPIILVRFNFGDKLVEFSEPFYPTDDVEKDFEHFHQYFKGIKGKYPELSFGID